ncbi:MAG: hypothetical protein LBS89_01720 [Zoogloeaceae bacterium]|jgi:hypothetical protein|nr:hypothetical protein [Zoogloeaceae bacterium]
MTPKELQDLSVYPAFPETVRELVRVLGLEAAAAVVTHFAGRSFRVPVAVSSPFQRPASRSRREILKCISFEVLTQLVKEMGGCDIYIPSCQKAMLQKQADKIRAEFDMLTGKTGGYTFRQAIFDLAGRYHRSDRWIEKVLKQPSINPRKEAVI